MVSQRRSRLSNKDIKENENKEAVKSAPSHAEYHHARVVATPDTEPETSRCKFSPSLGIQYIGQLCNIPSIHRRSIILYLFPVGNLIRSTTLELWLAFHKLEYLSHSPI